MSEEIITNFEKEIYKKYYHLVLSNCKRRLFDPNSIEDAVQSTFLMYIRDESKINSNLCSWFYWTSINVCKAINRGVKTQNEINEKQSQNIFLNQDKNTSPNNDETQNQLKNIMEKLPKKKQEMLLMRFYEEMTYDQIALHFKTNGNSVRKMIEHTLDKLRGDIKKKDIVFSVLFAQFFEKSQGVNNTINQITTSSSKFILQNSLRQQLIINSVNKMLLFAKLKSAIAISLCVCLPFSAMIIAKKNTGPTNEHLITNKGKKENGQLSTTENKAIKNEETKPVEIKNNQVSIESAQTTMVGEWKLSAKSEKFPCEVGSLLILKEDGTFLVDGSNFKEDGKYTVVNNIFTFYFSNKSIYPHEILVKENTVRFTLKIKGEVYWWMEYSK